MYERINGNWKYGTVQEKVKTGFWSWNYRWESRTVLMVEEDYMDMDKTTYMPEYYTRWRVMTRADALNLAMEEAYDDFYARQKWHPTYRG